MSQTNTPPSAPQAGQYRAGISYGPVKKRRLKPGIAMPRLKPR